MKTFTYLKIQVKSQCRHESVEFDMIIGGQDLPLLSYPADLVWRLQRN